MDFLKRTFKELYLKFSDDKDKRTPLIDNQTPLVYCSSTQPITPVATIMDPIPEIEENQLRKQAKKLREILGPTVSEVTIIQLVQNYNSIEAALNGYLDNLQNY